MCTICSFIKTKQLSFGLNYQKSVQSFKKCCIKNAIDVHEDGVAFKKDNDYDNNKESDTVAICTDISLKKNDFNESVENSSNDLKREVWLLFLF